MYNIILSLYFQYHFIESSQQYFEGDPTVSSILQLGILRHPEIV
jgi:hypothetical protein